MGARDASAMGTLATVVCVLAVTARADFAEEQGRAPRVKAARTRAGSVVKALFVDAGVAYPPPALFIRAFKAEAVVEVWAAAKAGSPMTLVKSYPVCARSGTIGPKRREGDGQVPEGFYVVNRFNPFSNFHLSLGLDYPNAADRVRNAGERLGGDIFIHGSCVTIGCLPLQDGPIEEVYLAALDAKLAGARAIPVHVFPHRMDDAGMTWLKAQGPDDGLWAFWQELRPVHDAFERTRVVPKVRVDGKGRYVLR